MTPDTTPDRPPDTIPDRPQGTIPDGPPDTIPAVLRAAASRFGEDEALVDGGERVTFTALLARALEAARAFVAAGVRPGDRVAIWAPNSASWITASFGVYLAGAVLVPLNTRYRGEEAGHVLRTSGACVLLSVTDFLDTDLLALLDGVAGLEGLRQRVVLSGPVPAGATDWQEFLDGGVKLRTLFVAPHAKERTWLLGLNFELGYDNPAFAEERWNAEIRPILGYRSGRFEYIVNPILDMAFDKHNYRPDFAPSVRFAYGANDAWKVGVEHYADLGPLDGNYPSAQQAHTTYAIVEWSRVPWDLHFGIGHGWTRASDDTIAKTILGIAF